LSRKTNGDKGGQDWKGHAGVPVKTGRTCGAPMWSTSGGEVNKIKAINFFAKPWKLGSFKTIEVIFGREK